MSHSPQVSILLPFHGQATGLEAAIRSIQQQTLQAWELLLLNNNASQQATALAQRLQQQDGRIRIIPEKRQGIAWALNTGLVAARTPFIARMDADDLMLPERLELQLRFLQQHPHIGVVACRCCFASTLAQARGYAHYVAWQNGLLSPEDHFYNRFRESPVAHPAVMFRRELVSRWGGYSTDPLPEDYELWLRWMQQGVRFAKLPQELLRWQDHAGRLSRTHAHYSAAAFQQVRLLYLALWIQQHVPAHRKLVICGASPENRRKAQALAQRGIAIWGYTDVKEYQLPQGRFIPISRLAGERDFFFICLIGKRGVGEQVRQLLSGLGFAEERDFMLAG